LIFTYSTSFTLNKAYFTECFEQTVTAKTGFQAYIKALVLFSLGIVVSALTDQYAHLSFFIVVLSVIEACSVYFQKTWWVWRQLLSRAANNEVKLVLDEQAITTSSSSHQLSINWQNVSEIITTEKGYIICHQQNNKLHRTYLSRAVLSEQADQYIVERSNI
jgi:hypothetical protein